ncbi:MAG: hypothetical protein NZ930_01775 [Candidatus Bipolaricaulota bacterium]|nr:hypothetical protein [Candidatus Bipolaricaulota bacterium]MDW8030976.1 hypothetical protein [Candidatus Bipolaricaulota bacterium]
MMMQRQVSRSLLIGLAFVLALGFGALAQPVSLTVTPYSDAVRFSAQGSVKELHVEILALSGQEVFDSGPVLSNALDWKLLNNQGQPVANGVYLYIVTVKDPSGTVTKRLGKLAVLRGKGVAAPPLSGITVGQLVRERLAPLAYNATDWFISGQLGVGTDTPTNKIQVIDTATPAAFTRIAAGDGLNRNAFLLERDNAPTPTANDAVAFTFRLKRGDGTYINVAGARGVLESPSGGGAGAFAFSTKGIGDTFEVERMRLTSTGNLGVGTQSPSALVHINNTANQPGLRIDSSSGQNALEIYNTQGGTNLIFRVERTTGNVYADGNFQGGGADVAERIDVSEAVEPGDVVEIDPENPGKFRKAREAISTRVAGVISTAPGVILGNADALGTDTRPILALAGRVPVKATAKFGAIRVGDLLVSSPIPGYAMKCPEASKCIGAVIGKALEPLSEGTGLIEIQVVLR